jgi:signal transduction histidine kinase
MLIKCSEAGHVLWMSPLARAALGDVRNLADTVVAAKRRPLGESAGRASGICLSLISGAADGLLLSAHLLGRDGDAGGAAAPAEMEGADLRRFSRLEQTARKLVEHSRRRQTGDGRAVIELIEAERARLGRELHTGVGQLLVSVLRQAELAGTQLPAGETEALRTLDSISTAASEALAIVRAVGARLHPPEWLRLSLEAAIEQLWRNGGFPQRYHGEIELAATPAEIEPAIKALFYRAAQEALSNIDEHTHATRVRLTLATGADSIELTVWDNGAGTDIAALAAAPAAIGARLGLRSIREQAAVAGGKVVFESGPLGTKLVVSAPFSIPA